MNTLAWCPRCNREWNGHLECHCPTCHLLFNNIDAFDRHRRRNVCLDPATELRRDGEPAFQPVRRKSGETWGLSGTRDTLPEFLARRNMEVSVNDR